MYYLLDRKTKKIIIALPDKKQLELVMHSMRGTGKQCYISPLYLVNPENQHGQEQGKKEGNIYAL